MKKKTQMFFTPRKKFDYFKNCSLEEPKISFETIIFSAIWCNSAYFSHSVAFRGTRITHFGPDLLTAGTSTNHLLSLK